MHIPDGSSIRASISVKLRGTAVIGLTVALMALIRRSKLKLTSILYTHRQINVTIRIKYLRELKPGFHPDKSNLHI